MAVTEKSYPDITTPCLICGEPIKLSFREETDVVYRGAILIKVCDKCKKAVMKMRDAED